MDYEWETDYIHLNKADAHNNYIIPQNKKVNPISM